MRDRATAAPNPVCLTGLAADLWPHTAQLEADGDISVGGLRLSAMAGWIAQEGLSLDVCSAGELAVARSVRFPADRIVLHGERQDAR